MLTSHPLWPVVHWDLMENCSLLSNHKALRMIEQSRLELTSALSRLTCSDLNMMWWTQRERLSESLGAEGLQSTLISAFQPLQESWSNAAISPRPICTAVYFNLASSEDPSRPQNLKENTPHTECVYQSASDLFVHASNVFLRILIWNQHCMCICVSDCWIRRLVKGSAPLMSLNVKWASENW